jgi:hypothetical protein
MKKLLALVLLALPGCATFSLDPCENFCNVRGGVCGGRELGFRDYSPDGGYFADRPTIYRCVFPYRRYN